MCYYEPIPRVGHIQGHTAVLPRHSTAVLIESCVRIRSESIRSILVAKSRARHSTGQCVNLPVSEPQPACTTVRWSRPVHINASKVGSRVTNTIPVCVTVHRNGSNGLECHFRVSAVDRNAHHPGVDRRTSRMSSR